MSSPAGRPELKGEATYYANLMMSVSWIEVGFAISMFTVWTITCWKFTQKFNIDYWFGLVTLVLACLAHVFLSLSVAWGTDFFGNTEIAQLDQSQFQHAMSESMKWGIFTQVFALFALVSAKLCIIAFLGQVLFHRSRSRPWLLWLLGVTNLAFEATQVTLILSICAPASKLWDPTTPGSCNQSITGLYFSYFAGSWSAFSDVCLALYPVPYIWKLQTGLRTKLGLCALMGFGILAAACAAIKTSQLPLMQNPEHTSYTVAPLVITTTTETWITLIVACVPPSAPFLRWIYRRCSCYTGIITSRNALGSDAARKRAAVKQKPTFGPKSLNQFHSLAYAGGTVHEVYELNRSNSSKEMIVNDATGILKRTEVDIQVRYEPQSVFATQRGSGDEEEQAITFDRI